MTTQTCETICQSPPEAARVLRPPGIRCFRDLQSRLSEFRSGGFLHVLISIERDSDTPFRPPSRNHVSQRQGGACVHSAAHNTVLCRHIERLVSKEQHSGFTLPHRLLLRNSCTTISRVAGEPLRWSSFSYQSGGDVDQKRTGVLSNSEQTSENCSFPERRRTQSRPAGLPLVF